MIVNGQSSKLVQKEELTIRDINNSENNYEDSLQLVTDKMDELSKELGSKLNPPIEIFQQLGQHPNEFGETACKIELQPKYSHRQSVISDANKFQGMLSVNSKNDRRKSHAFSSFHNNLNSQNLREVTSGKPDSTHVSKLDKSKNTKVPVSKLEIKDKQMAVSLRIDQESVENSDAKPDIIPEDSNYVTLSKDDHQKLLDQAKQYQSLIESIKANESNQMLQENSWRLDTAELSRDEMSDESIHKITEASFKNNDILEESDTMNIG